MKVRSLVFAVLLGVFTTYNPVSAAANSWGQYGQNAQNTGMSNYTGPSNTDYTWKDPLPNYRDNFVSPVMDDSSTIYLYQDGNRGEVDYVRAIYNTRIPKWTIAMPVDCNGYYGGTSMVLGSNGVLYVACGSRYNDFEIYALDKETGATNWVVSLADFDAETIGNLKIDSQNRLYLTGVKRVYDNGYYRQHHYAIALMSDGSVHWERDLTVQGHDSLYNIAGSVLSNDENTVYVYRYRNHEAYIHALDNETPGIKGDDIWAIPLEWGGTGWQQFTSFTVDKNGIIWLASYMKEGDEQTCFGEGEYLVGLDPVDGSISKKFLLGGDLDCGSHVRVGPSGTIYVTYDDTRAKERWNGTEWVWTAAVNGGIAAYDPDATGVEDGFKWRFQLPDSHEANASPAIDAAENIYFSASHGQRLYSIDKDGNENWVYDSEPGVAPHGGWDRYLDGEQFPYGVAPIIGPAGSIYLMGTKYLHVISNDVDKDGVPNNKDNCVVASNSDQADTNSNGIGDVCDGDFDADGVKDINDNCPVEANADQLDMDDDGIGFVCDPCPDDLTDPNNTCNDVAQPIDYPMAEDVTVSNGDGSAKVVIYAEDLATGDPSSISANTEIKVSIEPNLENFGYGAGQHIISAYTFTATANPPTTFNYPPGVTIVFTYEEPQAPGMENTLDIYWYDQANSKWVAQNAVQDTDNNTLTVTVSHFSTYALIATETPDIDIQVDIKPQSCPNPINVQEKGVIPVAILGSADFDVTQIDLSSVKLKGVTALRSSLEDVTAPSVGNACTEEGADGFVDLVLKFDAQSVVQYINAGDGEELHLTVQGYLKEEFGSLTIYGEDEVVILSKGKPVRVEYPLTQWAATAKASSEYSSGGWSAWQATGEPNTFVCDDIVTAWAPLYSDSAPEWIELGFSTPVPASGLRVHETFETGFIYRIDLRDVDGGYHTIWTGTDTTGCPGWFEISFDQTDYLVEGVKLYTQIDGWEEVDAVELISNPKKQNQGKGNK